MRNDKVSNTLESTSKADSAQNSFSKSMVVSGIRCVLTYVIIPFVTPLIGLAPSIGPTIGIPLGTVALIANLYSIRRFWKANHKWKKQITILHLCVIGLLLILLYNDLKTLL